jgi:hypothetical protein
MLCRTSRSASAPQRSSCPHVDPGYLPHVHMSRGPGPHSSAGMPSSDAAEAHLLRPDKEANCFQKTSTEISITQLNQRLRNQNYRSCVIRVGPGAEVRGLLATILPLNPRNT